MIFGLIVASLILIVVGRFLIVRATTMLHDSGLPSGRLIYVDTDDEWRPTDKPLYSATHNLAGKPDYLVETSAGVIPVEVKSSRAPAVPYLGHILQLGAYGLLVEESTGQTPPHGWLQYADALFEVDFTPDLRRELLDTMADMRQARQNNNVERDHEQSNKCRACGFLEVCDNALT
jgi:CRISPR-associated exonuclease Cas4